MSIDFITERIFIYSHIEILNSQQSNAGNIENQILNEEAKKVDDLERTVFIMKRVVEKLQAENNRLLNTKRPVAERSVRINNCL